MAILKVEPLTTARALRGPFDYRRPASMDEVGVGSVVRVPFGPRRILGVVVEVAEASQLPPERLAEPIEALAAGAPPELVELGLWVGYFIGFGRMVAGWDMTEELAEVFQDKSAPATPWAGGSFVLRKFE